MTESEVENSRSNLKEEIKMLMKASDLKHSYISAEGTEKLYFFSDYMNKGYCFILTI